MQYLDGVYSGELVDGKKCGVGKYEYSDGSYQEGEFRNNKFYEGNGTVKYEDGSVFEG